MKKLLFLLTLVSSAAFGQSSLTTNKIIIKDSLRLGNTRISNGTINLSADLIMLAGTVGLNNLAGIGTRFVRVNNTGQVSSQALHNVALTGDYNDLLNRPSLSGFHPLEDQRLNTFNLVNFLGVTLPNNGRFQWGSGSTNIHGDASLNRMYFYTQNSEAGRISENRNWLFGTDVENNIGKVQVNGSITFNTEASTDSSIRGATTAFVKRAIRLATGTASTTGNPLSIGSATLTDDGAGFHIKRASMFSPVWVGDNWNDVLMNGIVAQRGGNIILGNSSPSNSVSIPNLRAAAGKKFKINIDEYGVLGIDTTTTTTTAPAANPANYSFNLWHSSYGFLGSLKDSANHFRLDTGRLFSDFRSTLPVGSGGTAGGLGSANQTLTGNRTINGNGFYLNHLNLSTYQVSTNQGNFEDDGSVFYLGHTQKVRVEAPAIELNSVRVPDSAGTVALKQYTVPSTATITINGVTKSLNANPSFTIEGGAGGGATLTTVKLSAGNGSVYQVLVGNDGVLSTVLASGDTSGAVGGVELTAPNSVKYRVTIDNTGALVTTQL